MEFTGKTVKETVEEGLKELGLTEETAEITVKEEPVKGLFGKLKGKAVVDITPKEKGSEKNTAKGAKEVKAAEENGVSREEKFLKTVLGYLGIEAEVTRSEQGEKEVLTLQGEKEVLTLTAEDSSSVIGYRGEVLDALQTLTGAVANIGNKVYRKVMVDCENYRERREDTLIKLAHRLEEKATDMRREVHLEPMSPFERRIIHTALAESATVTTKSEGKEPNRFVVIVPNDLDEFSRPYNAGLSRGNSGGRRQGGFGQDRRGGNRDRGGRNNYQNRNGRRPGGRDKRGSGFSEEKRKSSFVFGTYLGNSFKDKD